MNGDTYNMKQLSLIEWIENIDQSEKHRPLAAMIAAASDLLAALENLIERDLIKDKQNDHYQEALEAIARAKGE